MTAKSKILGILLMVCLAIGCLWMSLRVESKSPTDGAQASTAKVVAPEAASGGHAIEGRKPDQNTVVREQRRSPDSANERYVDAVFGPVLGDLGLSEVQQQRIRHLLIERQVAAEEAHDILVSKGGGVTKDLVAAQKAVTSEIDEEIIKIGEGEISTSLRNMLESQFYLSRVAGSISKYCASSGSPLSGRQRLDIAMGYHEVLDVKEGAGSIDPTRKAVDFTSGLTGLDKEILSKLKNRLTPIQYGVVESTLRANTSSRIRNQ